MLTSRKRKFFDFFMNPQSDSFMFLRIIVLLFIITFVVAYQHGEVSNLSQRNLAKNGNFESKINLQQPTSTPTIIPTATPTVTIPPRKVVYEQQIITTPTPTTDWGVSKQVGEHTYTIKVGQDERMATSGEILDALNAYRQRNGKNTLSWDEKLAEYAKSRANSFSSSGNLDSHAGFNNFISKEDGFGKLGFNALGENSSYGYRLLGVHLIEWIYASDAPHNDNQLSSEWSHVGIGVAGSATDLIFGGRKR